MIEVGTLDFFTGGSITVNEELVGAVLMQFTGLHDKNGKEIYEGDVVKYKLFLRFHDEESDEVEEVKYVADENGRVGFAPMVWHTSVDDGYYNYEIEQVEIIGNLYENPELLSVTPHSAKK